MKLSVCVPVHNEEKHLGPCLDTLNFADEIVIGLDKCTDRSKEIAQTYNAVLVEGSWPQEGARRNELLEKTTGDWVLEIDADERITPELAKEIRQVIETSKADLHCIPFDNYIGDRLVRYGWGAYIGVSQKIALFRRGKKNYETAGHVHVSPVMSRNFGPVLKNPLIHYMDRNLTETIHRFDRYTTANAKDLLAKNLKGESFSRNFRRLFSRFYKSYVRRKGYKEGSLGFFIGMLAALYPMVSYIKAKYRI